MKFGISRRLKQLPAYLFVEIDKAKRKARQEGRDIIDLGIGDPDQPTPDYIIEALGKFSRDPACHRYALDQGIQPLRQAIADWYQARFNVNLKADEEILPLIGSKEGIAHFPLAFLNPGNYSLIPDPCYPPYKGGTIFAGGRPYLLPLLEKNNFLISLNKIPRSVLKRSKLLYINYPNNPTGATCGLEFYGEVVKFAKRNNIIIISDLAYSEIYFDGIKPPSFLEVEGAKEVAIEFHSLSKTYNMTGWRVGFACGNKDLVAALAKIKSNIDSGIFTAIQYAAVTALKEGDLHAQNMRRLYQNRRDSLVSGLNSLGWKVKIPLATFYLWARINQKSSSIEFSQKLLSQADIVVTPGVGFGESGEGFVRFALTVDEKRIKEAIQRIKAIW